MESTNIASTFKIKKEETTCIKTEPHDNFRHDDESDNENDEIETLNISAVANDTQEFYISNEEVDLTSLDTVRDGILPIDVICVEDSDEDEFDLQQTVSDANDIDDSFLFKENEFEYNDFKENFSINFYENQPVSRQHSIPAVNGDLSNELFSTHIFLKTILI